MTALDQGVGAGRWSMIVTSDHGASPLPEESLHNGRISFDQIRNAANAAASASELGPGNWIDDAPLPERVLLESDARAAQGAGLDAANKKVIFALRSFPGIEEVGRVADVVGNCATRTGRALALCLTFDPARSGDVYYLPASGWIFQDAGDVEATAHGSLHDYDQQVPVILMAPDRASHPRQAGAVGTIEMTADRAAARALARRHSQPSTICLVRHRRRIRARAPSDLWLGVRSRWSRRGRRVCRRFVRLLDERHGLPVGRRSDVDDHAARVAQLIAPRCDVLERRVLRVEARRERDPVAGRRGQHVDRVGRSKHDAGARIADDRDVHGDQRRRMRERDVRGLTCDDPERYRWQHEI